MASPSMTFHAVGDLQASTTINAGATLTAFTADFSTKFEGHIQFAATFGSVSTTAGLQISILPIVAGGTTADLAAGAGSFTLPAIASNPNSETIKLGPGKYSISVKNLDATNNVTGFTATSATVDAIS